ncbi:MAG: hypothetical protein OJF49_003254 [Ktedonobacterales bacterium]|jgi:mRNA interferase MazF|nr:MAG: hypothetical protein OJF49_003254 [Ktedonobacterales bacterium]
MSSPTRGEIWTVDLDPTRGAEMRKRRPAAVISSPAFDSQRLRIIVPITTWQPKFAAWSFMVPLQPDLSNGLTHDSCGNVLQVRCVAIERLVAKVGALSQADVDALADGIALCIDLKQMS